MKISTIAIGVFLGAVGILLLLRIIRDMGTNWDIDDVSFYGAIALGVIFVSLQVLHDFYATKGKKP